MSANPDVLGLSCLNAGLRIEGLGLRLSDLGAYRVRVQGPDMVGCSKGSRFWFLSPKPGLGIDEF